MASAPNVAPPAAFLGPGEGGRGVRRLPLQTLLLSDQKAHLGSRSARIVPWFYNPPTPPAGTCRERTNHRSRALSGTHGSAIEELAAAAAATSAPARLRILLRHLFPPGPGVVSSAALVSFSWGRARGKPGEEVERCSRICCPKNYQLLLFCDLLICA